MPQQTIQLAARKSDSRRITAALATEYLVDRAYGTEILQIERSAINFERFPLPTITQHNMANLPIGVAMNPRIINRELLADIVMGDSPEADRVYADIRNGVINNLPIGYSIDDAEEDDLGNRKESGPTSPYLKNDQNGVIHDRS